MYKHPVKTHIIESLKRLGVPRPSPAREDKIQTTFLHKGDQGSTAVLRLYDLQETPERKSQWVWFEFGVGAVENAKADLILVQTCHILYEFPYSFRPALVPYDGRSLLVVMTRGTAESFTSLDIVSETIEVGLLLADDLRKRLGLGGFENKAS